VEVAGPMSSAGRSLIRITLRVSLRAGRASHDSSKEPLDRKDLAMAAKRLPEQVPLRAELPWPVDLKQLHPIVRETLRCYRLRAWGDALHFSPGVSETMVERSIQILEVIVRECERRGVSVESSRARSRGQFHPVFKLEKGEVEIGLREKDILSYEQGTYGRTKVYTPTGFLIFSLESLNLYHFHGRKRWEERANKALETWTSEIVESIVGAAAYLSEVEEKLEKYERFQQASKAMQSFHQSVCEIQEKALSRLLSDTKYVTIARELHAYIDEIEKRLALEAEPSCESTYWLAWAKFIEAELDPLRPGKEPWNEPAFRKFMIDVVPPVKADGS